MMARAIAFTVNGRQVTVNTDPQRILLDVLREDLKLTGTKYGCGESRCGSCTVLINGKPAHSCHTAVAAVENKTVLTIEGLAQGDTLHPVQEAFLAEDAFQCGYCTPGMIMAAVALLSGNPNPTDAQIVESMNGHICRCGSYPRILKAIRRAAQAGR